jgi:hypothetical protein
MGSQELIPVWVHTHPHPHSHSTHIQLSFFIINFCQYIFIVQGGLLVTILIKLILYIIYISPILSPPSLLPTSVQATARGFLVLFCTGMWNPSTIYHHLTLLPSPPPCTSNSPGIHCAYFTILVFIINI